MSHQSPNESRKPVDPSARSAVLSFFPARPLHWVGAAAVFAILAATGAIGVIFSGLVDLSATEPHPLGWAQLLHTTFQRSTAAHAEAVPDSISLDDPALIMAGAAHYANVCSNCHGAPGQGQNPVALSLRPEPPMVLEAANHYTDGELFRIVSGGVRYSAMPAWTVSNRPDEVWSMVAFLKALPGMDGATYQELAHGNAASEMTTSAAAPADSQKTEAAAADLSPAGRPGEAPRPYLPGDPQSIFTSVHATDRPATGFVQVQPMPSGTTACASCHGAAGAGRDGGMFPNLTLQTPEYIAKTLQAFASGERQSGIMWPVAANLSQTDITRLADQFGTAAAKMSRGPELAGETDPAVLARGEEIALHGVARPGVSDMSNGGEPIALAVQSCQGCHGTIASRDPAMPHIAGQNAAYIASQLRLFRHNGRGNSLPYNPMSIVSHKLDDSDIEALAAYYASLPPAKVTASLGTTPAPVN